MKHRLFFGTLLFAAFATLLFSACGTPVDNTPVKLPTLKEGINEIKLGGDTVCSRGTDYSIFVRKGTVNKVVVDFEGGGACWDEKTCSVKDTFKLFKDTIDNIREILNKGDFNGIYDVKNPENPFKDWYHVFVPYCTGDIHWGNNVVTYPAKNGLEAVTIRHKGAVNAKAALKWVYDNFNKPEKIFSTGCSAGSYGSIVYSAHLANQYKNAKVYQMGDSGAGIITPNFLKESFPAWKGEGAMPNWIPALDPARVKIADQSLNYLYESIAKFYTTHLFSQFNTRLDKTQVLFYEAMGGKSKDEWSQKMLTAMQDLTKSSNFRSFTAEGNQHCIIPYKEFYTQKVGDRRLVDWLKDMIEDKSIKTQSCPDCVIK